MGTSGRCNACYLVDRIHRVVETRYPPAKAEELTHFLAKVLHTLEADTETFEADRTSGLVDIEGYLVEVRKVDKTALSPKLSAGVHPGKQDPKASSAAPSKGAKQVESGGVSENPGKQRRRRREDKTRSRSRSRRREKKKVKKEPTPEPEEPVAAEAEIEEEEAEADVEAEAEVKDEEVEDTPHDDEVSPDTEVARDPKAAGLRQVPPKPSARKPLPRRPRTPSRSPPGYRGGGSQPAKKWKGIKHIIRGQALGYSDYGRRPKGKGKGKWRRK